MGIGALRMDADTDYLDRSTDVLDYNSLYTFMGWYYLAVNRATWTPFTQLVKTDYNNQDYLGSAADGVTLNLAVWNGGASATVTGPALSVGRWYHLAVARRSTTAADLYCNGSLVGTNAHSVAGRTAVGNVRVGREVGGGNWFNGRAAALKMWRAALSRGEIQREMLVCEPVRTSGLYGWYPCDEMRLARYERSGTGRHMTVGGTLTQEGGPPIAWGRARLLDGFLAKLPARWRLLHAGGRLSPAPAAILHGVEL